VVGVETMAGITLVVLAGVTIKVVIMEMEIVLGAVVELIMI